ncbi:MAG: AtpZ/AtpI family protein [Desulfotignum sp.]|jgi:ATP synthase protein I
MINKETGKNIRELGYFASLGISVALSIFIGLGLGLWLDKKFDTTPVLMFVGLFFGIGAGFSNIVRAGKKGKKF